MTKDVILKVQGLQIGMDEVDGQDETIEVISPGEYYYRNDKHYFIYDEVMEGQSEVTRNIIKVKDDYMELTKKGIVNVHMVFEKNKQNFTYYYTPYGSLQIGIDANKVEVHETGDSIRVDALYGLEINNEYLAQCRIRIEASPRGLEGFQIMSKGADT